MHNDLRFHIPSRRFANTPAALAVLVTSTVRQLSEEGMSAGTGLVNCDPSIEKATAAEFILKNKRKVHNFVYGELVGGGELSFIIENLPKDGTGCPGWWLFDMMMQHFGASVTAIQGNWTYGDNLAAVNRITVGSAMTLEEAAKQGPTGKYAATWNFTKVEVKPQTTGTPGNYVRVHVLFKK